MSKPTAARNRPIGKCTSTTCCACLASRTVLGSNGFTMTQASLHHDFAGHLGVNGAEIWIYSRLGKRVRVLFVCVQRLRFEFLVVVDHGVGNIVPVGPAHRGACGYGDR